MEIKGVRLHGVKELTLDTFEIPEIAEDEILVRPICDGVCMSTYKVSQKGAAHKRVPADVAENPVIMGHEFCGIIEKVGAKWADQYKAGDRFVVQPNLGRPDYLNLGYSYPHVGGNATLGIVMNEAIEKGCLLPYKGETFFEGAMTEPLSCVVAGFKANFHLRDRNDYDHTMGIKVGGDMAIVGGTGPMGFLAVDYAIHGEKRPGRLVVAGRTQSKLDRMAQLYPVEEAKANGVELIFFNTTGYDDFSEPMKALTGGKGFDDVFVMVADEQVVTNSEKLLGWDGCLNFFAGPIDAGFSAPINCYNIHYNATHYVGTSGSNTQDMIDAVKLIENKVVSAGKIATHVLGLDSVSNVVLNFPEMPAGKKVCYSQHSFPLTDVGGFGQADEFHTELSRIVEKNGGVWTKEAEEYFMANAPKMCD